MTRARAEAPDPITGADHVAGADLGVHRLVGGAQPAVVDGHHIPPGDGPREHDAPVPGGTDGLTDAGPQVDPSMPGQPPALRRSDATQDLQSGARPPPA